MVTLSQFWTATKDSIRSDGTVIFTHGKLTGGSRLTQKKAIEHGKPVIHLGLITMDIKGAVVALQGFIENNSIEVLNMAGPRASEDERIYNTVQKILNLFIEKQSGQLISSPEK